MYMQRVLLCILILILLVTIIKVELSEFALLISGEELGSLEAISCDDDTGGLAKRASLLNSLSRQYPAFLNIHAGNIFAVPDRNSELLYQIALEALDTMKYDAVCIGPKDLAISVDVLQSLRYNYPSITFLCSNLKYHASLAFASQVFREVRLNDHPLRIALVNLISEKYLAEIQNVDNVSST